MLGQLKMTFDGQIKDKVEIAIDRLKAFEPKEGYWLAFSGGKDSQCCYELCKLAGVKFTAHYNVTTVDPPELVRFIQEHYPDAWENRTKPEKTMWQLIPEKKLPPTRLVRYCCEELKESSGEGWMTITGVRWAESSNRARNQGLVTFPSVGKRKQKEMAKLGGNFTKTPRGGVSLNDDNTENRRLVEHCYRTQKTMVNPIVDWEDEDVWEFLNWLGVPHCCLYDEGFKRLGCIGCPMGRRERQIYELNRWPTYKRAYLRAFEKMLEVRKAAGLPCENWKDANDVMEWWLEDKRSKVSEDEQD